MSCFFDVWERGDFTTQRDALLELAQVRIVQNFAQLWLARKHDLQLLRCVRFEIAEQPHFFQNRGRKSMRFVDNQDGAQTSTVARIQNLAEFD